jgi:heme exporter protein CcmD
LIAFGPHWIFIAAAYLGTVAGVALLILWVVTRARRVEARIERLETETRPRAVREGGR